MRKFTKNHNDINWLFPKVTEYHNPEHTFDEFEEIGQDLLESCYDKRGTFTRDDMMDAFMKGASVMNQILGERVGQEKALKRELDSIKAIGMVDEEVTRAETRDECIKWLENYIEQRKDSSHSSEYLDILNAFRNAMIEVEEQFTINLAKDFIMDNISS